MSIKVIATVRDISDAGAWEAFCLLTGLNLYAKKMGQVRDEEEFTLTLADAQKIGLVPRKPTGWG